MPIYQSPLYSITAGTIGFGGTGNRTVTFAGVGGALASATATGQVQSPFGLGSLLLVGDRLAIVGSVDSPTQVTLLHDWGGSAAAGQTYRMMAINVPAAIIAGILQNLANKGSAENPLPYLVWDDGDKRLRLAVEGGLIKVKVGASRPIGGSETATVTAMSIDPATGALSVAAGITAPTIREKLSAARTYYVRSTGSDSNNGLSAGSAFLTLGRATGAVAAIDNSAHAVTIDVGAGSYAEDIVLPKMGGSGACTLAGAGTGSTTIRSVAVDRHASWQVGGLRLAGGGVSLAARDYSICKIVGALDFGASTYDHMVTGTNATIIVEADYTISGGSTRHIRAESAGYISAFGRSINVTGTPAFTGQFAYCVYGSTMVLGSMTFLGGATGQRYYVAMQSIISTNGGGANYLPGTVSGAADTGSGGIYQ